MVSGFWLDIVTVKAPIFFVVDCAERMPNLMSVEYGSRKAMV